MNDLNIDFDIIIVGAGPAGFACSYQLRNQNLKIAIIDHATFPRDKICGDALSADVVNQFYRMDQSLGEKFERFAQKIYSHGVRFVAPNHSFLDINYQNPNHGNAAGYISKRIDFDHFLFQQIENQPNIEIFQGEKVMDIKSESYGIELKTDQRQLTAKMIIGADGAHSIVNRKLGNIKVEKDHYCAGIRQYYEGVTGFHANHHIELHFYKELLPGYFWIFPLPNGQANVGLGMLSSEVSKRKLDLKKALNDLIQSKPDLKERFKNANSLEKPQGFGLPIGSKKRPLSGERFLLLGDAASLIDPFTGEGIGNALRSGRIASEYIIKAFENQNFTADLLREYDKMIYHKMWNELRISRRIQMLLRYPKLFDFVVNKANSNSSVRTLLTSMLDNVDLKKELLKPRFYVKLLFGERI
ncbi:geranylgeranyl reductase family protein [Marivirga salinae]|uniref:Geranylgeranyl reductase family protein n=1 Tax=Marivirga salinarum TaxID=3059078 RepID=A0AA49GBH6_9BACT|nr:geranylgeranyl reductase family protein [Marivirga sp. BDSF4-3]WKK74360.2 geranylgeranyl reductase family protein [Marivirga sp. BDSF4-3]